MAVVGAPGIDVGHPRDYDKEAAGYAFTYQYMADRYISLVKLAGLKPGERVLDAACGPGIVGLLAAEEMGSCETVTFVDNSREMLMAAAREVQRRFGKEMGSKVGMCAGNILSTHVQDQLSQRSPGGYDVVFAHLFLHHFKVDSRPKAIEALLALCKPGGRLVFDHELPSASRGISGNDVDGTTFGIREVTLRPASLADYTMAGVPFEYGKLTKAIGDPEVARAEADIRHIVAGTSGAVVRKAVEAFADCHADKDIYQNQIVQRAKKMKDKEIRNAPDEVRLDWAVRSWLEGQDFFQGGEVRAGTLVSYRLALSLHVVAQKVK